jgi:hypothetical protein
MILFTLICIIVTDLLLDIVTLVMNVNMMKLLGKQDMDFVLINNKIFNIKHKKYYENEKIN